MCARARHWLPHSPCNLPPAGCNGKKIALIGKGLTFDSGGYNIKVPRAGCGWACCSASMVPWAAGAAQSPHTRTLTLCFTGWAGLHD